MPKILIVDDQATNRAVLRAVLKTANPEYELFEAVSGAEALGIVAKELSIDAVLRDVLMPDMDGFAVCTKLKSDPKTRDIPVIFVTGLERTDDKVKGFQVGGADYITKPINPEEAIARIAAHLKIRKAEKERLELENLETVKNMVVTYNHNMNQPLMASLTYIELLLTQTDAADKRYATLKKMKIELNNLAAILKKIQAIEKPKRADYVGDIKMIDLEG